MISNAVREAVRQRIDLSELVGQYVPLRRAGLSMVARCPFHEEKTPSFHVSPERGLFHCFGCKASGDVFTFFERIEGVSFVEALRALAGRAGVEIEEEERDPARVVEERRVRELTERMYFACEVAAEFFEASLASAELSALARDEIASRGVQQEVATRFRLGYAPAAWDALASHFRARGVSPADAEQAGLLLSRKHGGGHYDRFRHRLMFPIWDRHGKIVAFSGRVLPITEDMPEGLVPEDAGKYINSPETPLFKKSELLFGLQAARAAMRVKAEAILVEGNFDVAAMHQHGFAETVAPLGTAFTDAQARLLRRFAESVTLVFDADEAGRRAARAAHAACARVGLVARVAVVPKERGKDPDEVLRAPGGADFLRDRITHAPAIVEWLIDDAAATCGDTIPDRAAAMRGLAPVIAGVTDRLERSAYVDRAARSLHFPEKQVEQEVREAAKSLRDEAQSPFGGRSTVQSRRDEPFRRARPVDAPDGAEESRRRSTAMADAINALLRAPALLADPATEGLIPLLDASFARPLITAAREQWLQSGALDGPALIELAPHERARMWLSERLVAVGDAANADVALDEQYKQAVIDCAATLRATNDQEQAKQLKQESARARASGDDERAGTLMRQAQLIDRQRIAAATKTRGDA